MNAMSPGEAERVILKDGFFSFRLSEKAAMLTMHLGSMEERAEMRAESRKSDGVRSIILRAIPLC